MGSSAHRLLVRVGVCHPVSGNDVTNLRTINLLTYIILNNYLENINLQKISYTSTVYL